MPQILQPNPLGAISSGLDVQRQRQINSLGQMQVDQAPAAYAREQVMQGREDQQYQQSQHIQQVKQGIAAAQWVQRSASPKQAVLSQFPELVPQLAQQGFDINTASDADVIELAKEFEAHLSSQIGAGPTQDKVTLNPGDLRVENGVVTASAPFAPEKPTDARRNYDEAIKGGFKGSFYDYQRSLTAPQQAPDRELVPVIDPATGQTVLKPRSEAAGMQPGRPTTPISPRDQNTARQKLVNLGLAKQQLQLVKQKFSDLAGSMSAGAFGQGYLPSEKGKQFDAAVNSMRDIITGLTRTPGVGSMSDFETRLNQAKMPDRKEYESVTAQQIQSLDDMINSLGQGYSGLLEDAGVTTPDRGVPSAPAQPASAAVAPEGTIIRNPQGQTLVKRGGQWVPR